MATRTLAIRRLLACLRLMVDYAADMPCLAQFAPSHLNFNALSTLTLPFNQYVWRDFQAEQHAHKQQAAEEVLTRAVGKALEPLQSELRDIKDMIQVEWQE